MKNKLITLTSILFLLLLWQLIAIYLDNPVLFPDVPGLFRSLGSFLASTLFYQSVGTTIGRGLLGISISFCFAGVFSFLFARIPALYEWFRPLLTIMRSVPVISFILLALLFLNSEVIPLLIGFLTMFPILTENLTKGIVNLDKEILCMGKAFQINRTNYIFHILYPQLKPFLYSGLANAAGFGWRAIIMGEVLSQCASGIGSGMKKAQLFIDVPELLAWTTVAIIISFLTDKGINKLAEWNPPLFFQKNKEKTEQTSPLTSPIELKGISFTYGKEDVFKNFSLLIPERKITGISGGSGKGKTTLLYLISTILPIRKGMINYPPDTTFSWVFQRPVLLPHLTVYENIALPLTGRAGQQQIRESFIPLFKELQIEELTERLPDELSYGQQQRVAIARGLLYPAGCLLMDEPFKGLEKELVSGIITTIKKHQQITSQTIIFTTHQPDELEQLAQHIVRI